MKVNSSCPLVSVIIVAFNGWNYSRKCLRSVLGNSYRNFEVIFVNDGSRDETSKEVKKWAEQDSRIRFLDYSENKGPGLRRDQALEYAQGKYVAFLDNDTEQDHNWLVEAVKVMEADPMAGAGQCKLLLLNDRERFDYVGDYLDLNSGFLIQVAALGEIDKGQYDCINEIFAVKSAGMIARRDVLNIVGGFDKDYFIYMEETDLCWRMRLSGYKVIFMPKSKVYHAFGGSGKEFREGVIYRSRFHGCKNYIMTHVKNLGLSKLLIILPVHLLGWLGVAGILLINGKSREGYYVIKALCWNLSRLNVNLRKRRDIQKKRKVPDKELFCLVARRAGWVYFFSKFRRGSNYLSKLKNTDRNDIEVDIV